MFVHISDDRFSIVRRKDLCNSPFVQTLYFLPFIGSTVSSVLSALAAVTGTHVVKGLMKNKSEIVYVWISKFLGKFDYFYRNQCFTHLNFY